MVDPSAVPVQHTSRRIPVALKKEVKAKLEDLERKGIIVKETAPTEWISNVVLVAKPGKIRICLDPQELNKVIQRPKYEMPTLEELLPKLYKAKIFSTLDAKDGFYQISLDQANSKLTTFWTPFGRYRYLRMPFGVSLAPEEFGCLRKARDSVFWPGMSSEIKEVILQCSVCAEFQQKNHKEPMQTTKLPDRPWSRVAIDIFTVVIG